MNEPPPLKQIEEAKGDWELENKKTAANTATSADLYGPKKYIRDAPTCPAGGKYSINAVGTKPSCSIPGQQLQQF
jgi:hypothetical protein